MVKDKPAHRPRMRRSAAAEPTWEEWIAPNGKTPSPAENGRSAGISELAYSLWQERGCPHGSPEVDWFRAESILGERTARN